MSHVFSSVAKFSAPGTKMAPTVMPYPSMGPGPTSLSSFGISMDNVVNRSRVARSLEIANGERPSNIIQRYNGQTSQWHMYAYVDWLFSEVSILPGISGRSSTELLRYGIEFMPRFAYKCMGCGQEVQNFTTACPHCGGTSLRKPDPGQKKLFVRANKRSFLDEVNDNGWSMKDLIKAYAEMEYQNNQAYILCVTGDIIDSETKELVKNYPLEFVVQDPKYVKFLYDETGKPGTQYAFTRDQRNTLVDLDQDPDAENRYDAQGRVLYPAAWQIGQNYGGTGPSWFYAMEEVYQDKWFTQSLVQGIPIWFSIEDDILTYHYLEKHFLKKYKFGYVRKMLILPGFGEEDVEAMTNEVQNILATNDNSIPIICTPPSPPGITPMDAQVLELGTQSDEEALHVKEDIRDRICAHAGVPNIFVGDVESSGGMNNESQQITTFDRYLMDKYERIDRILKWIISWFPKITDWVPVVSRPGKAYTDFRKRMDEVEFMTAMKQAGFDVKYIDGEFRYSEEPIDQVQRRQQEAMMQQQAMMQQMMGGAPPEESGEDEDREHGGPDKGTARRDDPDINASKGEVDQAMDEAGSMMGMM